MKFKPFLLLLILGTMLFIPSAHSQNMTGLWLVEKVSVGDELMTPVSKWFKLHENGKYESGNGWLQNTIGRWTYDGKSKEFSATNTLGINDEAGAFQVSFSKETMIWSRMEEGMNIKVHLQKVSEVPPSYTDLLAGLWQSKEEIHESGTNNSGPLSGLKHLQIRWDRIYRATNLDNNNKTGYWHVNGHRPELTLLPHQSDVNVESWRIKVSEKELELTGISESNKDQVKRFLRIHQFPD